MCFQIPDSSYFTAVVRRCYRRTALKCLLPWRVGVEHKSHFIYFLFCAFHLSSVTRISVQNTTAASDISRTATTTSIHSAQIVLKNCSHLGPCLPSPRLPRPSPRASFRVSIGRQLYANADCPPLFFHIFSIFESSFGTVPLHQA